MDKERIYNTQKEWTKDFKFNNHWYHLSSLFDLDANSDNFDFNSTLDAEFDFNSEVNLDSNDIDFNDICTPEEIDFNVICESAQNEDSDILERYGLSECFESINEDEEFSDVSKEEQQDIKLKAANALASIEQYSKQKAALIASGLKKTFLTHGKKAFLAACVAVSLLSGNGSITTARLLERISSGDNQPSTIVNQINPGGGTEIEMQVISRFISRNFHELDNAKSKKIAQKIMKDLELPNRFMLISLQYNTKAEIPGNGFDDFKIVARYCNKEYPNKHGKYQELIVLEPVA